MVMENIYINSEVCQTFGSKCLFLKKNQRSGIQAEVLWLISDMALSKLSKRNLSQKNQWWGMLIDFVQQLLE